MNEFFHMLGDPAHWAFEILVTVLIDGLLLGIFWPMVRNCWRSWKHPLYSLSSPPIVKPDVYGNIVRDDLVCEDCGTRPTPLQDGIDVCTGCGDVQVSESKKCDHILNGVDLLEQNGFCLRCLLVASGCALCDAGIPMSRNGSTHCIDDCGHGSVGEPCTRRENRKKP